jgi:hypothetical protein
MISYWSILNSIALLSFGIWESNHQKKHKSYCKKQTHTRTRPLKNKNKTIYHFVLDINQENCLITIKGEIEHSSQLNKALKTTEINTCPIKPGLYVFLSKKKVYTTLWERERERERERELSTQLKSLEVHWWDKLAALFWVTGFTNFKSGKTPKEHL